MPALTRPVAQRPLTRLLRGLAVLALGVAPLAACGGSSGSSSAASSSGGSTASSSAAESSSSSSESAQALTATEADFSITLDKDTLTAGSYAIKVVNNGKATHDLAVEENGTTKATSDKIGPGESTTLMVDLDAGEYVFYCSIGNHRAMGMEKTIKVT